MRVTNRPAGVGGRGFICTYMTVFALVFSCFRGCSPTSPESPKVKVGLGETVIRQRENLRMGGFARSQVATGVHDDLHARSIVIEGGNGTVVVMTALSLVGIDRPCIERIRKAVNEETGIPEENILVSCTHTHSGPRVSKAGEEYRRFLVERAVESVVRAWNNRFPARIGVGATKVMELGRNRRRLLYGGLHPDPEVGILKIEDSSGRLKGVLFNYGCHPSALDWRNTLYSEDWPHYAIEGIKSGVGGEVWTAYFQSAEGDINVGYSAELSAVGAEMPIRNYDYIAWKGTQMAEAVLEALPAVKTSGNPIVRMVTDFFEYPLRDGFPVSLEQAGREAAAARKELEEFEREGKFLDTRIHDRLRVAVFQTGQRLDTARRFYGSEERGGSTSIEQQAVRVGDAVFVAVPGEIFSEIGLKIKEASPFEKTFVIGLANGYGGYLPTAKEFIEGDYEVDGCRYSDRAEKVCIDSSLELIRRLE